MIDGGYLNYNKDKTYFIADANGNATTETGFVRPESYDVFTGNTLQYNNSIPITIKEIGNFQAYNFTLNPELADGTTALIKANKIILGSSDDNMSTDQVQKQIYNSISIAAQTSESLDNAIKEALPSIADDEVNPNYAISDDIKDAVLNAEDISQSVKNLLTTGKIASDIKVIGIQSGKLLDTNTKFILMQADQGQLSGLGQGYLSKGVAQQGISLLYDVETSVDQANDQVIALINMGHKSPTDPTPTDPVPEDPRDLEPTVNPQLKALLKGNLSGLMLLTRSEDQFSNYSFDQEHLRGLVPFVIASGNHSRYDTGSHIKSNGGLFTMGFSVHDDDWTWGAFIENGWDSYKTHDSFKDAKTVNGRGHNRFNGVGLFGNYDFNNGWYVDGTLRGGRLHTSFETDDLRNAVTNERAEYDLSSNYYGVSLKGGYNFTWNPQNELDLSAKYAWVGTESHRLTIAGDPIYFDKLNSHRLRLNAENSYQMNSDFNILTGLGYEHEFAGKAKGTTYGVYDIEESSVKGGTGIATLGLRYQPAANQRLNIDLKGSGYFGKREGGSALLKVDYKF